MSSLAKFSVVVVVINPVESVTDIEEDVFEPMPVEML